jgi:hypothetical protein
MGEMRGAYRASGGDLRERDNLEDLCIDWKIILKSIFKNWDGEVWTGFIWLRIGAGGELFSIGLRTSRFHKMRDVVI